MITGLGVVAPNGIGTETLVAGDEGGQERHRSDHAFRPVAVPDAARRRGRRLRRRRLHRAAARSCRRTAGRGWRSPRRSWRSRTRNSTREGQDPYRMSVITASSIGWQRVRPEGDPEPLGQGADLRRRVPVDRLVLRGDDRADLDQARHEGALRRRRRRGRRRARMRSGTRAATIRRGVDFVVSGGTEAPHRPVRAHVPADERAPELGARS